MRTFTLLIAIMLMMVIVGCSGNSGSLPTTPSGDQSQSPLDGIRVVNTELQDVRISGESVLTSGYINLDSEMASVEIDGIDSGDLEVSVKDGLLILPDGSEVEFYEGKALPFNVKPIVDKGLVELDVTLTGDNTHSRKYWLAVDMRDEFPTMPYEEAVAISPDGDAMDVVKDEILVGLVEGTPRTDLEMVAAALDMQILERILDTDIYRLSIPEGPGIFAAIQTIEKSPVVEYAEPNLIRRADIVPNDSGWSNKYDLNLMDGPEGWDIFQGDTDVIVGVIDSGIDRDHPDLAAKVIDGEDFISGGDGLGGETPGDGVDNNGDYVVDGNVGHGTHCSGIIGAVSNNGTGTTGVDWSCRLMGLRVFPTDGDSGASSSAIMQALQYAKNTPNLISVNLSLGGPWPSASEQTVYTQVYNAGVIACAAAGNNGSGSDHYPSSYDNVISVAATDSNDKKASFSQYCENVDVCAPGVQIYSTYYNNTYAKASGTSMATPEVTGLFALVKGYYPSYSTDELIDQVKYTTDYIYDKNPSYVGRLGTGRVNIHKALYQQLSPVYNIIGIQIDDDQEGITEGNGDKYFNTGEVVALSLKVRNDGIKDANDPVGILTIDDPYVHVLAGEIDFPDIPKTVVKSSLGSFLISIDSNCPDGHEVNYTIDFDDADSSGPHLNEGSWTVYKNEYTSDMIWLDGTSYPDDGKLSKGIPDQALLRVDVSGDVNYGIIESFTLYKFGTVATEAITDIRLYHDSDGDHQYDLDGTDVQLAVGTYHNPGTSGQFDDQKDPYSGNPGGPLYIPNEPVRFSVDNAAVFENIDLPASVSESNSFFIVIDLDIAAVSGSTLQIGIMNQSDVDLRIPDLVDPDCLPLLSNEFVIQSTWQTDYKISSGNSEHSWRPEGATDPQGNVYIVIDDDRNPSFDIYMLKSTSQGEDFEPDSLLTSNSSNQFYPSIAVDSNGILHVVYYSTEFGSNNREIMYLRSFDQGNTWDDPVRLTNASGDSRVPDIGIGPDNILHVCWIDDRAAGEGVFYKKSEDGGENWSSDKIVANVNYYNNDWTEPRLAVGGDNSVHIAWYKWVVSGQYLTGYDVNYVNSHDTGDNFSSVTNLTPGNNGFDYAVRIAADNLGNPYVVYHHWSSNAYDIYCKYSTDGGDNFLTKNLTGGDDTYAVRPDISIDLFGNIDVVFKDNIGGVSTVYHITSDSGINGFNDPVQIAFGAEVETLDEWPRVMRGPEQNIYAFWADMRDGQHEIYFNRYLY